ncbi:MAG: ferritin family protein [Deltaproteobacteria bacterium]|nr:ferritin family protein [Deltaproteobacteria bacterium]
MDSINIFTTALKYEEKIRDLYLSAASTVDDDRGRKIFTALADDEQSHIDFLNYSLEQLRTANSIDPGLLKSAIPDRDLIDANIEKMKAQIPEKMLGDIKTLLASALKLEKETSAFYLDARDKTEGVIKEIFTKFYDIEQRHVDVVQIEIDHAMNNGMWFDFMEVNLELE